MKLLLVQNISYRLVHNLISTLPELTHVRFIGLLDAEYRERWDYAKSKGYTIVTFDVDFYELQTIKGFPPKIVWLRFGNMTRSEFINFFKTTSVRLENSCNQQNLKMWAA